MRDSHSLAIYDHCLAFLELWGKVGGCIALLNTLVGVGEMQEANVFSNRTTRGSLRDIFKQRTLPSVTLTPASLPSAPKHKIDIPEAQGPGITLVEHDLQDVGASAAGSCRELELQDGKTGFCRNRLQASSKGSGIGLMHGSTLLPQKSDQRFRYSTKQGICFRPESRTLIWLPSSGSRQIEEQDLRGSSQDETSC